MVIGSGGIEKSYLALTAQGRAERQKRMRGRIEELRGAMGEVFPGFAASREYDGDQKGAGIYFFQEKGKRPRAIQVILAEDKIWVSYGRGRRTEGGVSFRNYDRFAFTISHPVGDPLVEKDQLSYWPVPKDDVGEFLRAPLVYLRERLAEKWEGTITKFERIGETSWVFPVVRVKGGGEEEEMMLKFPPMQDWKEDTHLIKKQGEVRIKAV